MQVETYKSSNHFWNQIFQCYILSNRKYIKAKMTVCTR